jgi:hypothetical protein
LATRLYFHAANFDTGSYPGNYPDSSGDLQVVMSNPQPSFGISGADAVTVHRSMTKTKGSSETSFAIVRSGSASTTQTTYVTKFISDPLKNVSSISSNTWSSQTTKMENNSNSNYGGLLFCIYVWRPSANSKVGSNIYAFAGCGGFDEPTSINTQRLAIGNFAAGAGSSVSGVQDDDVIICEVYHRKTPDASATYTDTTHYDGSTEYNGQSNQTIVTDMAAFIETPQDLEFVTDSEPPVDMTVTGAKNLANKRISKA